MVNVNNFRKIKAADDIKRVLEKGYSLRATVNGGGDPIYVICEPGEDPSKGVYVSQVHINDHQKLSY